jgi:hypothetical protein
MSETATVKPRRRRFALSLQGLMILILVIGGILGWKAHRATIQRRAVAKIDAAGGTVQYDYQIEAQKASKTWTANPPHPWAPDWLRRPIGEEYFQDVAWVFLSSKNPKIKIEHDPKLFETVATLDRVEMLQTIRYPMDNADFARLMAMPRLKQATFLLIDITDEGLACLESSPAIEELVLRSTPGSITNRGLEIISRQPRIKRLELTQVDLTDPKSLAPLAKLTRLENLMLMNSPEEDSCLSYLSDLTELKRIDLRRTCLTDSGIDSLSKLKKLETVLVDGSLLTDAGLAKLAAIPSLKEMYLDPLPKLGELGISSLDKLQGFPTLCLTATNVTDAGLGHLKGMKFLRFKVSGPGVTDAGLEKLAAKNQFVELDLSRTSVTGPGMGWLAFQSGLRWLALDGSKVDDAGAVELAKFHALAFLSLDATAITDATLVALEQSNSLRFLTVRGTRVTPQGLEAFQKARPGVIVKSGPAETIPDGS